MVLLLGLYPSANLNTYIFLSNHFVRRLASSAQKTANILKTLTGVSRGFLSSGEDKKEQQSDSPVTRSLSRELNKEHMQLPYCLE